MYGTPLGRNITQFIHILGFPHGRYADLENSTKGNSGRNIPQLMKPFLNCIMYDFITISGTKLSKVKIALVVGGLQDTKQG